MRRRTVLILVAMLVGACGSPTSGAASGSARIAIGAPSDLDPAATGDAQSSALIAQLFETLTAIDDSLEVRPALAQSWHVSDGGRRVVFRLRPDLRFSDGSPLRASDVVRSWLRIIDPAAPSPLATLMLGVRGAADYADGRGSASDVGLTADDSRNEVGVDLVLPTSDFPSIVASPTFAVVPPGSTGPPASSQAMASSRAAGTGSPPPAVRSWSCVANPHYWAGEPAIWATITVLTDLGGRQPSRAVRER